MCRLAKNVVSTIEVVKVNFEKNEPICFLWKSFWNTCTKNCTVGKIANFLYKKVQKCLFPSSETEFFFITILGEFFFRVDEKTAKMGKELGIEWMKEIPKLIKVRLSWVTFLKRHLSSHFLTFVQHDGMTFFKRSFTANWCLNFCWKLLYHEKATIWSSPFGHVYEKRL